MTTDHFCGKRIAFLGAGIIAEVFIERLLKSGGAQPEEILATDPREERLNELRSRFGIQISQDNKVGADFGDIIVLAMPPGAVKAVLSESCQAVHEGQMMISFAAAVPTWLIESVLCKPVPVVRVIPNIPSLIGQGMNPYCLGKHVPENALAVIQEFLGLFGSSIRIDERLMNAATALTAVGPTYVLPVISALASAAEAKGIAHGDALSMAAQSVAGAARLVCETGRDPAELKMMIATRMLDEETASSLFTDAFNDAFARALRSEGKVTQ
ncbi:MAG: pyrroline-5-carboxylate reductase [Bacteroidota bacterium]